ncbi:MAG: hypothetical protein KDD06_12395, partial [Phaeodactylibacter sp.]|nr:hypothetical protein [Phaeodactylibacter sp.]
NILRRIYDNWCPRIAATLSERLLGAPKAEDKKHSQCLKPMGKGNESKIRSFHKITICLKELGYVKRIKSSCYLPAALSSVWKAAGEARLWFI